MSSTSSLFRPASPEVPISDGLFFNSGECGADQLSAMRNRIAFRFFNTCACALRALSRICERGAYAATRKTATINLAIVNERRG